MLTINESNSPTTTSTPTTKNHLSSLMAQRPHVPQFGKWDNAQNAAYTVYFDQARKGRTAGGKMTNPNDPEDNPDILPRPPAPRRQRPNDGGGTITSNEQRGNQVPARGRGGSLGSEHSIERSTMHPRGRGEAKNQGAAVPVFGEWDVKNPASGEGYTDIFNEVRVQRESGSSNTPGRDNFNNYNNHHPRKPASDNSSSHKICCFPWRR